MSMTGEPQFDRGCFVHEGARCTVQERSERQGSTTTCNHSDFIGGDGHSRGTCSPFFSSRRQAQNCVYSEVSSKVYAIWKRPRRMTIHIMQSGLSSVSDTMNFSDEAA